VTGALYRLGHFCGRHGLLVLVAWLLVAVGVAFAATAAGENTTDNLTLPGTGSQNAADVLNDKFPSQANGSSPIVFEAPAGARLTDARYKDAIEKTVADYRADPAVRQVIDPFSPEGATQLNPARTIGYLSLTLAISNSALTPEKAQRLVDLDAPLRQAGMRAAAGGLIGQEVSNPSTELSESIGLAAAVIILLFTFGTVVAMGLPILTALFGLATGLGIIALLSHVADVPSATPALATMIGLGVGIDYALFVVTRHRRQMNDGMEPRESAARATATAGGAVVFAGGTVIIALCSLAAAGLPLVTTLGYTSASVVVVAVAAAISLLPAILGLLGTRINRFKVPGLRLHHDHKPRGWARWARFVADRPWPALAISVVVLAALTVPAFGMHLGQADNGALPEETQARQAYDLLARGFGVGANGPVLVAVDLSTPARGPSGEPPAADPRLQRLRQDMARTAGVAAASQPLVNGQGSAALYTVTPTTAPSSRKTEQLVDRLRADTIPAATRGQAMSAYVGGATAGYIDLADEIGSNLPTVIAIVLVLSFVLLLLAFRSLLVPLKAVVMNLLSIGAAFGIVTYVFDHHWSAGAIGLPGTQPIVSFVPLMMFAILFGLSMDYEVFLMTHVREHWRESGDAHESVIDGLASTARVITSAALIMVSVFAAFVLGGDPTIKQFGLGMAAAVAVDASLIRCVLVPAIMSLLGRASWWMPRWLDRITPELSIEGGEWFLEHDADSAGEHADDRQKR
jgi:RND superfamily putative drug exporter